jgi:hypothetical protein
MRVGMTGVNVSDWTSRMEGLFLRPSPLVVAIWLW